MKKAVVLPFSILALAGLYIYATPYITVYQLSEALREKSAEKIEPYIDFPSVRDSVRSQVMEYVENEVEKSNELDPSIKEFSSGIINSISGMYIDSKIRSKNLEKWLDGERLFDEADNLDLSVDGIKESYGVDSMGYIDPNRFAIEINGDNSITSIQLERSNIVNWKLTSISVKIESDAEADDEVKNLDSSSSTVQISCDTAISTVQTQLKGRLLTPEPRTARHGPLNSNLWINMKWTGPKGSDDSRIRKVLNDSSGLKLYSQKILDSCEDLDSVSFNEFALDGSTVTYERSSDGSINQCAIHLIDEGPHCRRTVG